MEHPHLRVQCNRLIIRQSSTLASHAGRLRQTLKIDATAALQLKADAKAVCAHCHTAIRRTVYRARKLPVHRHCYDPFMATVQPKQRPHFRRAPFVMVLGINRRAALKCYCGHRTLIPKTPTWCAMACQSARRPVWPSTTGTTGHSRIRSADRLPSMAPVQCCLGVFTGGSFFFNSRARELIGVVSVRQR
jgi:hypothetical protein